ncbi:bifunctional (p)ppGpp synthetase/guanosine-3',5'-bis(diphosphate) 3'-pyrophosphohydrolase [Cardinium endosymbiont of Bemisia tabaci]|uniref:bifunctional (p)ppGpp synthetase/guanosine-3',5'-bis(diphosphate) 3'-pyrophosphohydrolase n=1 Tax=Cardinium endosymbiont of Bemisia tabaci TaxID=672794 RepID=UPI000442D0D5|nr:bifunctional (p)ppGpp synthetase/guanosine-3',5'-bis(diphosphate) 3'-pyrophosphohydrolase [Cardinium endosymbiont of Bemisia tabaci]CDG49486.1 GTP pyrophosphokinase [Cardinium endosymbiont cBtQ1 of Bemisia tabaci]
MIKRNEILHLNNWNLHQLARAVSKNSKDIKEVSSALQEASSWLISAKGVQDSKVCQYLLRECIRVATIAATELSLNLPAVVAVILAPLFLKGLVRKKAIQNYFGLETAAILVELRSVYHGKFRSRTILSGLSHPDVTLPRIVAILLQIADIIRVNGAGILLKSAHPPLIYYSGTKLLLDLKRLYIPLSHRMRLYNIQAKLADFWLKHTYTLSYYSITAKLGMTKLQREQKLNLIAEEVYSAVHAHGIDFILKKRIKSVYSIWHKIQRLKVDFDQIHDLAAVRIILTGMDGKTLQEEKIACWKVLTILSDLYKPICNIMRDWISIPRDSSYESLHFTFETCKYGRLEVQIRTERMDHIAEHGEAAHWKYKYLD